VVADRAGHAMHTAVVSRLLRDQASWEEVTLAGEEESSAFAAETRPVAASLQ